jgi:hypothetical protein
MLNQAAMRFHAVKLVGAAHEDDGSDSDDSDSEEEEVYEPLDGDIREDANTDVQDTVDFEEASLCPSPVHSMCPLPGRLLLQPSSSTRRGQRASAASASPLPAPSLSKPRVKATAKDITAASPTASTSGVVNSEKRKAKRAAGPRASKQRVVAHSDTSSRHPDIPIIPGINEDGLPAPPNSANVPPKFHFLLRTGFTLCGRGMKCYDPKCKRVTGNYADMMRHFKKHFRLLCSAFCQGCPRSFSRDDAARRHMLSMKKDDPGHCSSARKAFLVTFNELPVVVDKRANCNWNDTTAIATMDNALYVFILFPRDSDVDCVAGSSCSTTCSLPLALDLPFLSTASAFPRRCPTFLLPHVSFPCPTPHLVLAHFLIIQRLGLGYSTICTTQLLVSIIFCHNFLLWM